MMERKLVVFATLVALLAFVTLQMERIHILLKWESMLGKNYGILAAMLRSKAKLFCLNSFVPFTRDRVFMWENFHPGYRDLGHKNRDPGNRASQASK